MLDPFFPDFGSRPLAPSENFFYVPTPVGLLLAHFYPIFPGWFSAQRGDKKTPGLGNLTFFFTAGSPFSHLISVAFTRFLG